MSGTHVLARIPLCVSTVYSQTNFEIVKEQILTEPSVSPSNLACLGKNNNENSNKKVKAWIHS